MSLTLYNLTLQNPTTINSAVPGNFTDPNSQELLIAKERILEILRVDREGNTRLIHSSNVFGIIRSIQSFRFEGSPMPFFLCYSLSFCFFFFTLILHIPFQTRPGQNRDYIVVGSDSGKVAILEYDTTQERLVPLHLETFGKTGCRRIVPGQYVTVDPRGRALMIGFLFT